MQKKVSKAKLKKIGAFLDSLWTIQDVCQHYDRTPMAVHLWMQKPQGLKKGVHYLAIAGNERGVVRFVPENLKDWARKHKIKPPEKVERFRSAA